MSTRESSILPSAPATGSAAEAPAGVTRQPSQGPERARRPSTAGHRESVPTFYVVGFWRRLAAAGVDLIAIGPVAWILTWLAGILTGVHLPASRHYSADFWLDLALANDPALLGIIGLTLAIAAIYVLVFQLTLGCTPGMHVMKIRIIDQYGDQPSTPRVALRTAGYLLAAATLGLGFLWIGFDSEKRGLHDWIAGTYVVKA